MKIYDTLSKHAENTPDKICIIYKGTAVSYKELNSVTDNIARKLASCTDTGDRIILIQKNPIKLLYNFIAASKAGLAAVIIHPDSSESTIEELKNAINPTFILNEDFSLDEFVEEELPEVLCSNFFLGALSSGSTGTPKLIWRDHISWTTAFPHQSTVFKISADDTLFLSGSLMYTANLNSCLHILYEGGRVVFSPSQNPKSWLRDILQYKATSIFMVPAHYKSFLKTIKDINTNISSLVSAGDKIDIASVKKLIEFFPNAHICEYYGASELGHVSYSTAPDLLEKPDSVGKPFPKVKLSIMDTQIWVESPYLAPAYRPFATVGDIGYIEPVTGCLYLKGRVDSIINKGGTKINTTITESILKQHPEIEEVVVMGMDDSRKGKIVAAWIVTANEALSRSEVMKYCTRKLTQHYRPQKIYFIDRMPRNTSNKIDKKQLSLLADRK